MRLIDADAFEEEARKRIDMQDLYLPTHIKDFVIDEMPTVEAIPIEWIEQYGEQNWFDFGTQFNAITCMLKAWEERKG